MPAKDHYKTLGLTQQADDKEIKRRFRELARRYHPDMNGKEYTSRFHEINEAYQVLSDHRKRSRYDIELREAQRQSVDNAGSGYSDGYVRPQRPAPAPGQRYSSHRRPPAPEPTMGRVVDSQATNHEAIAGVALLVGMIACAVLSYTFLEVLNVLAGDPSTVTVQNTDEIRDATRRADLDERQTQEALPTTTPAPRTDFNTFTLQSALMNDPDLNAILHATRPLLSNYCIIDLSQDTRPCGGREARRINTITGSTRDNRVSLAMTMDRPYSTDTAMRRAVFIIEFTGRPTGVSLNIADSRESNGDGRTIVAGGVAGSAEVVIDDGNFYIYGYTNDCTENNSTLLYAENDFVASGSRLILEISDQRVRWINEASGGELISRCLFQLGGQTNGSGAADFDIYAGLNRAVRTGTSQQGNGVGAVEVYLLTAEDE